MKKKIFVTFLLTASLILTFPTFTMASSTEPESPTVQTEENIETEKVSVYFQVIKPNGEWAIAGGNSSVIIKKGEQGSKTYTINNNDKKDVTINGTDEIYQYLGTWGDGKYDASSGKIKLDRATVFNEYKQDGQAEVTVYIKADYNIIKNYYLDINYIDNVANGGGGDSHYNNKTTYTHTFRTPADIPAHYDFLYWENQETNERYIADDTLIIEADSLNDDKTINIYATYDYQPSIRVIYHYKDGIKDTGEQWSNIDIYENQPEELYWFYEDEDTPIEKGAVASLPEKRLTITEKQDYTEQVDVYAHYYTVTWQDENGTILETDTDVPYGSQPSYDEASPTKEEDSQYTYTFVGWDKELKPVTEDVIYTAVYDKTEKIIPKEKEEEEINPPEPRDPVEEIPKTEPVIEDTPNNPTPTITRVITTTRRVTRVRSAAAALSNPAEPGIILTTSPEDYAIEADPVEEIKEDPVPLATPISYWALLNLLLVLLTVFEIFFLIICPIIRNKKEEDKEEEIEYKYNYHYIKRTIQIILSIFTVWVFCITEDITLPMRFVDKYTVLMVILAVITTIVAILCGRDEEEKDKEYEGE